MAARKEIFEDNDSIYQTAPSENADTLIASQNLLQDYVPPQEEPPIPIVLSRKEVLAIKNNSMNIVIFGFLLCQALIITLMIIPETFMSGLKSTLKK